MRTVSGRTDRVVVVGAGLGGLSAALRLAGTGRDVVVVERESVPGGRAGVIEVDGYRFDSGPTVLTMPSLIADAFACVDESLDDWLDLTLLDPAYRAFFPDGTELGIVPDRERMTAAVAALCGARDADGYRRFMTYAERMFTLERNDFIDRNLDSPLALLRPSLATLISLGGMRRLAPVVASYVRDPRLRRVLSFQTLYAGVAPDRARALYASITHLDAAGVYFPTNGLHEVPRAMASAATKHGVDIRYDTTVESIVMRGDRATGVTTSDGEHIRADVVVVNADLPIAWDLVRRGGGHVPSRRMRWSPSCFVLHLGARTRYRRIAHHNLHFGRPWVRATRDLARGRLMEDPSLLVTSPTVTDRSLAPPGRTTYTVIALVPTLDATIDWSVVGPRYRDEIVARLEAAGYVGLGDAIEYEHVVTPADWARQGFAAGTPLSLAHTFAQTGPFRPGNLIGDNVVLAGCGTRPGIGIPMVLLSGRLAAERIIGQGPR